MKMKTDARIILPLILVFWIPITFGVLLSIYQEVAWQIFGFTKGITLDAMQYGSLFKAYLSVFKEIGFIGSGFLIILVFGYIWMTYIVFKGIKNK